MKQQDCFYFKSRSKVGKIAFILNRGQKSEILPSVSLATGKLKRCLLHYDVKDECTKIISKNLLLPQYYCNIPCQCVKGSNVVERFYGHTTENTSRLGYKHVCVNYLHVASHDYQYQEVIQHTHWHTHIHTHVCVNYLHVSVKTFTWNNKTAFILNRGRSRKFDLPFHSQLGNWNGVFFITMLKTNVPK